MKLSTVLLACLAALPLSAGVVCGDSESRQLFAWQEAVSKYRGKIVPNVYTVKELETVGGYSYLFFFEAKRKQAYAFPVMVVMDGDCQIRYLDKGEHGAEKVPTEKLPHSDGRH